MNTEQDRAELLPCPFCGCAMSLSAVARDWWRITGGHNEDCILYDHRHDAPQTDYQKQALIEDWNRRAALQSQDAEDAEWMTCESRRPWVTNSLKQRAQELRAAEKRSRNAFNKDYMGEPARYFADACGEAAAVLEAKLIAIDHARRVEGERNARSLD